MLRMMMSAIDVEWIARALGGDAAALASVARMYRDNAPLALRFAALVRCDRAPHPLAVITAAALLESAPTALLSAARCALSDGLDMLVQSDGADLRAALAHLLPRLIVRLMENADWQAIMACARLTIVIQSASAAATVIERVGAVGWKRLELDARTALLDIVCFAPKDAASSGGAVWAALDAEERRRIVASAARWSDAAALLLQRIGADEWNRIAGEDRMNLLSVLEMHTSAALEGVGAVWRAMTGKERTFIVRRLAACDAADSAQLMERIGAEGWAQTSLPLRKRLLRSVCTDLESAVDGVGAAWSAMTDEERDIIAGKAMRMPDVAAALLERIGAERLQTVSARMRAIAMQACARDPAAAAHSGGTVWRAMTDIEQRICAQSASHYSRTAETLMCMIGSDGWEGAPKEARRVLLRAVCGNPSSAAVAGSAVWDAMTETERATLVAAVQHTPDASEALMKRLAEDGWARTAPEVKETLLHSVCSSPWCAAHAGGAVWRAMSETERAVIVTAVQRNPDASARLIAILADHEWEGVSPDMRETLLQKVCSDPSSAASAGKAVWNNLTPDERNRIMDAAARSASAVHQLISDLDAAQIDLTPLAHNHTFINAVTSDVFVAATAMVTFGAALNLENQHTLLRAVIHAEATSRAIVQALRYGAPWRSWMVAFIPDANEREEMHAWQAIADRLPVAIATRLLVRRPQRGRRGR